MYSFTLELLLRMQSWSFCSAFKNALIKNKCQDTKAILKLQCLIMQTFSWCRRQWALFSFIFLLKQLIASIQQLLCLQASKYLLKYKNNKHSIFISKNMRQTTRASNENCRGSQPPPSAQRPFLRSSRAITRRWGFSSAAPPLLNHHQAAARNGNDCHWNYLCVWKFGLFLIRINYYIN